MAYTRGLLMIILELRAYSIAVISETFLKISLEKVALSQMFFVWSTLRSLAHHQPNLY